MNICSMGRAHYAQTRKHLIDDACAGETTSKGKIKPKIFTFRCFEIFPPKKVTTLPSSSSSTRHLLVELHFFRNGVKNFRIFPSNMPLYLTCDVHWSCISLVTSIKCAAARTQYRAREILAQP